MNIGIVHFCKLRTCLFLFVTFVAIISIFLQCILCICWNFTFQFTMLCWQNTVVKVWFGTKTLSGFQKYLILLRRRWLLNVSTPKILKPLKVVVPAPSPPATDMKVSYDSYKCWFDEFKNYFTDLWFEETYNAHILSRPLGWGHDSLATTDKRIVREWAK